MKIWLRKIGDAFGMAFVWAFGWACLGMAIEVLEPDPTFIDVWVTALAMPGFIGGLLYAIAFQLHGGATLGDVPTGRTALLGALTGVLLGVIVIAVMTPGGPDVWVAMILLSVLVCSVSALAVRALARAWQARRQHAL